MLTARHGRLIEQDQFSRNLFGLQSPNYSETILRFSFAHLRGVESGTFVKTTNEHLWSVTDFAFLVLLFAAGLFCSVIPAWSSPKAFTVTVTTGNGYVELPVGDRIQAVYSKDSNFALIVAGLGTSTWTYDGTYIVDWQGHILWAHKGGSDVVRSQAESYLVSKDWVELKTDIATDFGKGHMAEFVRRDQDRRLEESFDSCLSLFYSYFKITTPSLRKSGFFLRFLNKPQVQTPGSRCGIEWVNSPDFPEIDIPKEFTSVSTRVCPYPELIHLYRLNSAKALMVSGSFAIFVRPDFSFYADHPADVRFITVADAVAVEKRAMQKITAKLSRLYISPVASVLYNEDKTMNFQQAETLIAEELDRLFKGEKQ